jgi:hypothetical protein
MSKLWEKIIVSQVVSRQIDGRDFPQSDIPEYEFFAV